MTNNNSRYSLYILNNFLKIKSTLISIFVNKKCFYERQVPQRLSKYSYSKHVACHVTHNLLVASADLSLIFRLVCLKMSDQKDLEKGSYPNEEKIALKDAENCGQATGDHEKSAANGGEAVKIVHPVDKQEFCGLSKEELQQFAKDPFWRKVRVILFAGFWVAWMAMLLAAIIIIILAPKCPKRPDMKWWEKSLFYRVCPRTYKDNDGDGNGDFKGC